MKEDLWILAWLHALSPFAAQTAIPMPFDVVVKFTPEAAERLKVTHEKVIVSAYYYADPDAKYETKANEIGQIDLGDEELKIEPNDQTVHLEGKLSRKGLKWAGDHAPRVNINVYSARLSGPDNILDCNIFEDDITVGQTQTPTITCGLIYP